MQDCKYTVYLYMYFLSLIYYVSLKRALLPQWNLYESKYKFMELFYHEHWIRTCVICVNRASLISYVDFKVLASYHMEHVTQFNPAEE